MQALKIMLQMSSVLTLALATAACMPSNFKPVDTTNGSLGYSKTFAPKKTNSGFQYQEEAESESPAGEDYDDSTLPAPPLNTEDINEADIEEENEEEVVAESKETVPVLPKKEKPVTSEPVVVVSKAPTETVPVKKGPRVTVGKPPVEDKKEVAPKAEAKPEPTPKATPTSTPTPKAEPKEETPKEESKTAPASDFSAPGMAKPTVYFFAIFNEDESKCTQDSTLHGKGGAEVLRVCKNTLEQCGLQGSCAIVQNGKSRAFNVLDRVNGVDRFFEIDEDQCRFGYGVRQYCLDPFYTLAADLSIYRPGQVIYVPKVRGTVLPDGTKHSGYFVIRDQGRGIKGSGRFDFFSGTMSWRDEKNPFKKLGLGDQKTRVPYFRVNGNTAKKVLENRAFPKLPQR